MPDLADRTIGTDHLGVSRDDAGIVPSERSLLLWERSQRVARSRLQVQHPVVFARNGLESYHDHPTTAPNAEVTHAAAVRIDDQAFEPPGDLGTAHHLFADA